MNLALRTYCFMVLLASGFCVYAQQHDDGFTDADARRAYQSATDYLNRNDYSNAIMMYTQAIRSEPGNVMLRRDLAYAYYLSGDKEKAKEVIDPVLNSDYADEQTYRIASAIEASLGNRKKAARIVNDGLKKFPASGQLYNAKGSMSFNIDGTYSDDAIAAWQRGIEADPAFPANYYNAAKYYYDNKRPVWTVLYAEIYANLDRTSARTAEMKKLLIDAYKMLLSATDVNELPDFKKKKDTKAKNETNFEAAYKRTMNSNAIVIGSGLNVESLIMLRTRFILAWNSRYANTYFSTLFAYHDKLLRTGNFDAYNQWLFGAADNSQEFGIWIKNNQQQYSSFEKWTGDYPYMPSVSDPKP